MPDLSKHFTLADPPLQYYGHDMPSDPDFSPECGFLTHDEAAILYNIAKAFPHRWVDIGCRFGWSTAHIAAALTKGVWACDPVLQHEAQQRRFESNLHHFWGELVQVVAKESEGFFRRDRIIDAAMIDGNHDSPEPTLDAARAITAGASVLVWHDFQGRPVRDAVEHVMGLGWSSRVYWTPNIMAVAWNPDSGFVPPDHERDPEPLQYWAHREWVIIQYGFDVRRCV